jgi:hypothetical protein
MPKGRTNQPLIFMVDPALLPSDVMQSLIAQGHTVKPLPDECLNADIIFGVNCHVMTCEMITQKGMLQTALRAARKRKKGA